MKLPPSRAFGNSYNDMLVLLPFLQIRLARNFNAAGLGKKMLAV